MTIVVWQQPGIRFDFAFKGILLASASLTPSVVVYPRSGHTPFPLLVGQIVARFVTKDTWEQKAHRFQTRVLRPASGKELVWREWLLPSGDANKDKETRSIMKGFLKDMGATDDEAEAALQQASNQGALLHGHPALPLIYMMLEPDISKRAGPRELLVHECLAGERQRLVQVTPKPRGRDSSKGEFIEHLVQSWREQQQLGVGVQEELQQAGGVGLGQGGAAAAVAAAAGGVGLGQGGAAAVVAAAAGEVGLGQGGAAAAVVAVAAAAGGLGNPKKKKTRRSKKKQKTEAPLGMDGEA